MNNQIIEKIKELKIKPKWHFAIKSILLVFLTVSALFTTLFLASFLLFYFGRRGVFLGSLPLIFLILIFLFIFLAEYLVNRYAMAYRKPVIYSLLAIIFIVFILGFVLNQARMHERLEKRNLPGIRRIYKIPLPGRFAPPMREINFRSKMY